MICFVVEYASDRLDAKEAIRGLIQLLDDRFVLDEFRCRIERGNEGVMREWHNSPMGLGKSDAPPRIRRLNPFGEFLRSIERGTQHDELDVGRTKHDRLFPDVSATVVVDIMDLVHDNGRQFRVNVDLEMEVS